MNKILESTKFVVNESKYVKINEGKIDDFCKSFTDEHIKHWLNNSPYNFKNLNDKEKLHFLLVLNSMSFSYWGNPKWTIEYKNKKYDGAFGMLTTLGRAIENNFKILDPNFLAEISKEEFEKILHGSVKIPLFEERWKIIREVGTVLLQKYNGNFENILKLANQDCRKLLDLIINNFPSFEDSSIYKGKKIHFYKRAQLLILDIYQVFNGQGYGKFKNIRELTACADYKLPQALRRLGILNYNEELAEKVDNKVEILKDSEEEIEIRANTIWAVELIEQKLKPRISHIDTMHINDRLWLLTQIKSPNDKPYHLTRTTAY